MNSIAPVFSFAITRREAPALVEGERTVTYRELADLVRRSAGHLSTLGVQRGDRVGLCLKDTADHVIALLAVLSLGAVAVPLDWRARPAENARFLADLGLAWTLCEPEAKLLEIPGRISLDAQWHQAVSRAQPIRKIAGEGGDLFAISASSGSTGLPKLTAMTHLQFHFAITGMLELMDLSGLHRFLCPLPLYYSGGRNSCLAHLLRGDCVVLYSNLFTNAEFVDAIERYRITVAGVVPSVIRQLLAGPGDGLLFPRLTTLFSTGATLHAKEKQEAARRLTPNFHERYGTAETMAISVLRPHAFAERSESVGQPHSFAEVEVVDEDDKPLPANTVGRLRFRGPGLASPLPGAAAANFRNGWYYPGEIARLDEAGYIFLQGRTSDVIQRNGAKVYPAEVEGALLEHPGVLEAAVLGERRFDDADTEESVIAFILPLKRAAMKDVTLGDLLVHCRMRLSPHKVPRRIHLVDRLPKNAAGKIDKIILAKYLAGEIETL